MKSRISSMWPWLVVVIVTVVSSSLIIDLLEADRLEKDSQAGPIISNNEQTLQDILNGKLIVSFQGLSFGTTANPGLPVRLRIPKINVDAALDYVGLTPDGVMDITKGPDEVAWYELGPRPGDNGSAVIAGHYGRWKNGAESVFDDLDQLSPGDRLYVEDEDGVTTVFVVRQLRTYDAKADATDVFGSSDGQAHLNLVTCSGVWNEATQSYPSRLVIFTDKE